MGNGRPYRSIGDVLDELKEEFPDISVSKIRFLESAGLLTPERTASGYRMFHEKDVERLRSVLRLQRDSFLPLKVIKERLAAAEAGTVAPEIIATPAPISVAPPVVEAPPPTPQPIEEDAFDQPDVQLSDSELADAAEIELAQVRQLKEFGVVCEHAVNGSSYYDGADLAVAKVARDLLKLGLEPRHLKSLRRSAEQEAGMYEQLVAPALRNRRPEAREQATETLTELVRLSKRLHDALLRQSIRRSLLGER